MNALLNRPTTPGLRTFPVPSKSRPGVKRHVTVNTATYTATECDCPAGVHTRLCWHKRDTQNALDCLKAAHAARPGSKLRQSERRGPCPSCGSTTMAFLMSVPTPPDYLTPTVELLEVYCPECGRVRE
jgi:hypothetical protein